MPLLEASQFFSERVWRSVKQFAAPTYMPDFQPPASAPRNRSTIERATTRSGPHKEIPKRISLLCTSQGRNSYEENWHSISPVFALRSRLCSAEKDQSDRGSGQCWSARNELPVTAHAIAGAANRSTRNHDDQRGPVHGTSNGIRAVGSRASRSARGSRVQGRRDAIAEHASGTGTARKPLRLAHRMARLIQS